MRFITSVLLVLVAVIGANAVDIPVTVTNPYAWTCTGPVKMDSPFNVETVQAVVVTDGRLDSPAQVVADSIVFTAKNVPSSGSRTYRLRTVEKPLRSSIKAGGDRIENEFFQVRVDPITGGIASIVDKKQNIEVVPEGKQLGVLEVLVGGQANLLDYTQACELVELGPSRAVIRVEHALGGSQFVKDIILYESVPRIDIRVTLEWVQPAGVQVVPVSLRMLMPTVFPKSCAKAANSHWADLTAPNYCLTFAGSLESGTDFEVIDGSTVVFSVASINAEAGAISEFTCSINPHTTPWTHSDVTRCATELRKPMKAGIQKLEVGS